MSSLVTLHIIINLVLILSCRQVCGNNPPKSHNLPSIAADTCNAHNICIFVILAILYICYSRCCTTPRHLVTNTFAKTNISRQSLMECVVSLDWKYRHPLQMLLLHISLRTWNILQRNHPHEYCNGNDGQLDKREAIKERCISFNQPDRMGKPLEYLWESWLGLTQQWPLDWYQEKWPHFRHISYQTWLSWESWL